MKTKKILVVSDSHGRLDHFRKALKNMEGYLDHMFFLGDCECDPRMIQQMVPCDIDFVRGNCDSSLYGKPNSTMVERYGHRFYLTHGHMFGYGGTEAMFEAAAANDCDALLFGHTHIPMIERRDGIVLANPGSISRPRQEGHRPSYMVINIEEDGPMDFHIVYL